MKTVISKLVGSSVMVFTDIRAETSATNVVKIAIYWHRFVLSRLALLRLSIKADTRSLGMFNTWIGKSMFRINSEEHTCVVEHSTERNAVKQLNNLLSSRTMIQGGWVFRMDDSKSTSPDSLYFNISNVYIESPEQTTDILEGLKHEYK